MWSEFRFAARSLARWRGGFAVAVVTLAIGIGTATALYALTRVLIPDLPGVARVDRLARVYASNRALEVDRSPVTLTEFDSTVSKATSFVGLGAYADVDATLGMGSTVRPIIAGYASPGFFTAMGVPPLAGRVFAASDLADGDRPAVILSHALWRREFPDGRVAGATVMVDGIEREVVGVMPPEFRFSFIGIGADLWMPLRTVGPNRPPIVAVFARLRDDVGWGGAGAELAALSRGHQAWTWRTITIAEDARHRALTAYAGALGPALLILLIACVNVACLLLARGVERDKELSVRRALGASRRRVIRLLLVENLLLGAIGGTLGGLLAVGILRVIAQLAAFQPSLAAQIMVDFRLLPIALVTSAAACAIFGITPALRASTRDVAAALKGLPLVHRIEIAGYGGRDAIVFAEIACAVGLIVWTAMFYTLLSQIGAINLAFPADHIVAMRVPAPDAEPIAARVAALPGVARVAISAGMLGGGMRVRVETGTTQLSLSRIPVGDGFLETLGVPLLRGRAFDASELRGRAAVAILSESSARRISPDGEVLGTRLRLSGDVELVVIGVCRDAIDYGALAKADPFTPAEIYVPYEGSGEAVLLARVSADPHPLLAQIAAAAHTPARARPVRAVVVSEDFRQHGLDGIRLGLKVVGAFAALTLLLAASGVFAVITQSVAQRTREFGIRLALGAAPRGVLAMVLAREAKLIGLGVAVGLVFTMALTHALFVELSNLNAILPALWIAALLFSVGVAAGAAALAAYRITRLQPSAVLRRS
jgi:putative ABC transport system permease protein